MCFRKRLDLKNPKTYNEKLQWIKIYDRNPRYSLLVDKYEVKKIVGDLIGHQHIIKTYGVWNTFDEIDFDKLPNQFVLKCTHDSGSVTICKDNNHFDKEKAREKIEKGLKFNVFRDGREWPYKNVKPRIIAEAYMEDLSLGELRDYKFFTFNGKPHYVHIVSNRQNPDEETYGDFFDMDYNHVDLTIGHNNAPVYPNKPVNFEKMKEYAELLAKDTKQLRVDFYEVNGELYFGELTFFPWSGYVQYTPDSFDFEAGEKFVLTEKSVKDEKVL
jgi:hypothetical protein